MLVQEKMSLLVIMSAPMTITARVVEIVRIAVVQVARTFLRMIIHDSGSDKADKKPAIISCTIEIRCDEATAKKSSIDNPGIRELIPDSGIILGQISYSGYEGISAYDVLSAAANMNGISVDTKWTTQYGGVYVTAIAGLEEMMVGRWSGWMYSVNGKVPMTTASSYNVENGDAIVWYYYAP